MRNPNDWTKLDIRSRAMVGDFRRDKLKILLERVRALFLAWLELRSGLDLALGIKGAIRSTGWKNIPNRTQFKYTAPYYNNVNK